MLNLRSSSGSFGGTTEFYSHHSDCCNSEMKFSIYVPPQAKTQPVPVLYFLSGLTCSDENFMAKAGAQRIAAKLGIILVAPDTSPREGADDSDHWDFGIGASFYVDALLDPWRSHYQMYSYITHELPALIADSFPVLMSNNGEPIQSICGHSMGGHGALVCALRSPNQYRSVSAFAPIGSLSQCAWGEKAFTGYLGTDRSLWSNYDGSELVRHTIHQNPILIDQGMADGFLESQLKPELFEASCHASGQQLILRRQPNYDHSYYFIASFIEDHLNHHHRYLS